MRQAILTGFFSFVVLGAWASDYLQSPGHFGGFGSDFSFAVADEFVFQEDSTIKAISWWGGYMDGADTTDDFAVRIFC